MDLDRKNVKSQEEVYGWICALKTKMSNDSTQKLELSRRSGKKIALCAGAGSPEDQGALSLWLEYKDHKKTVLLAELGTFPIKKSSKTDMKKNLHPLFSRLCIYAFLGVTHRDIVESKREKQKKKKKKKLKMEEIKEIEKETEKLLRLDLEPETISKTSFGPAFNALFYAVCSSLLIKQDNGNKDEKDKLKKLAAEILQKIGEGAAESLMKSLASKRSQILSEYKDVKMDGLTISYSSTPLISMTINCYCTRLEMDRKIHRGSAGENLEFALNDQMFQCILGLDSAVNFKKHFIEVELTIGFLRCKSLELDSKTKERYFPAKIGITMWPESDFEFNRLSLHESSRNPCVSVCTAKSSETGLHVQLGPGTASVDLGRKDGRSTSYTQTLTNWERERDQKAGKGTQEWTLRDIPTGKSAFDYGSCCTKHDDRAVKAFAGMWSDGPLTKDGGVNFEGEKGCGPPMTWRFNRPNINLERKSLKWSVEVEIWLAYYGNEFIETGYRKFDGLSLEQHFEDPTEPQVPLKWVIVLCILFLFYNRFLN